MEMTGWKGVGKRVLDLVRGTIHNCHLFIAQILRAWFYGRLLKWIFQHTQGTVGEVWGLRSAGHLIGHLIESFDMWAGYLPFPSRPAYLSFAPLRRRVFITSERHPLRRRVTFFCFYDAVFAVRPLLFCPSDRFVFCLERVAIALPFCRVYHCFLPHSVHCEKLSSFL